MLRRGRRHSSAHPEIDLPITPMLDMAFQLLFFFICTFQPPKTREGQLELTLGRPQDAAPKDADNVKPGADPVIEPEVPIVLTLRLYCGLEKSGGGKDQDPIIEDFALEVPEGIRRAMNLADPEQMVLHVLREKDREKSRETLDKDAMARFGELLSKVHQAAGPGAKEKVRIEGFKFLKWGRMVEVMDTCRKAGLTSLSFEKPNSDPIAD